MHGVVRNVGVMWNSVPRCGLMRIMMRCEMWCNVKCRFRDGAIEMQNVEYGVVWNVVSWYVECCIMQDVESYDVI